MRVVLDTNALVAAFIARGVCADVFERVIVDHELVLSPHIVNEFKHAMVEKLQLDASRVERSTALFRRIGRMVDPPPLAQRICRDQDDDAVLALARFSGASCLVTGDDDLLTLEVFEKVPIITPRAFLTFEPPKDTD